MIRKLLATSDDSVLTALRLVLGIVMFAHGAQKVLGWFGGYGYSGTMQFFTGTLHIPAPLGILSMVAEFAGSLGLIVGLLGRVAALGILVNMVVAVLKAHAPNGFFMNWAGNQKGEGFEFHLLAIVIALAILVRGSGAFSIDRWITRDRV
ncbi:DoxX [Candidatus Koribacter versatilis Ellin345]|uniref:DoxX n=1 Tax=Koribacter versatilis (strain Ellin345) TaxID=204669 RepID=Q1IQC7_KORVE|nr:DoxX family protein [Candidatus Koribacter versatilis]ABF40923.1 DoxX [Candidatus Koribacter versatilis Ellin345]